ncbi:MAG: T9SS type A sorting domain-containing protein [Candidatus Marinimicrobia bacterium]|nr:T9SS type A sorting domain-containing protein [Candidatus Neomarinimicrobiota bacterium]
MKINWIKVIIVSVASLCLLVPAMAANGHVNPDYIQVVSTENALIIDGILDETDWARRFDYLVFNAGYLTSDVEYAPSGDVLVTGGYPDTTTTLVKFMHHGLDLYISLTSDDQSVGKFGNSWEGDGLFMKIQDAAGTAVEYKLYFNLTGVNPDIAFEIPGLYPTSGSGAAWKHAATIVNDTTAADSGYTAEMVIHLDQLGYTDPNVEIPININIFDPDGYIDTMDPWTIGSYHKMWWGSEWGCDKIIRLADPPQKIAYKTDATITLDGELSESFWTGAEQVVIGKGSLYSTGGYYSSWGDTLNSYVDQSMATVKFMHNGTDLYIGVESNDASVCKWSPGWEADGLFLWMTNKGDPAPTARMEIKAMYFSGTEGDGITFETNANVPTGAAEGASFEPTGTVTHTEAGGPDAGYSLEIVVHTADFGYSVGDTVLLSACIWDLDSSDVGSYHINSADYAPNWWGTQWADPNFEKYFMYRGVVLEDSYVGIDDEVMVVKNFKLYQNYPNPFNPSTLITFDVPTNGLVTLEVFNLLGQSVARLAQQKMTAGHYEVMWNGLTADQSIAPAGVYFYRLTQGNFAQTAKMVLMK